MNKHVMYATSYRKNPDQEVLLYVAHIRQRCGGLEL